MEEIKEKFRKSKVLRGTEPLKLIFNDVTDIGGIFCGGYIRYMISEKPDPPPAQDIDIYSQSEEIYERLSKYFKNLGLKIHKESDYSVSFRIRYDKDGKISCPKTDVSLNIDNTFFWDHNKTTIQLVKPVNKGKMICMGSLEEILSNFDFTIVRCGLLSLKTALRDKDFHVHDEENKLQFKNIHSPVSSLFRIIKYGQKGYKIKPSHLVKLFLDWDDRPVDWKDRVKTTVDRFEKYGCEKKKRNNENNVIIIGEEETNNHILSVTEMEELEALLFVGEEI